MNSVILCGRLTKDPDVRYSQGDNPMAVARFTVAVERRVKRDKNNKNQQTADFPSCLAFGKTAEVIEKYCHKGSRAIARGHIRTGNYTNKDGQKVYTTDVVVDEFEFGESRAESQANGNAQSKQNNSTEVPDGFMSIPDGIDNDELPFA